MIRRARVVLRGLDVQGREIADYEHFRMSGQAEVGLDDDARLGRQMNPLDVDRPQPLRRLSGESQDCGTRAELADLVDLSKGPRTASVHP